MAAHSSRSFIVLLAAHAQALGMTPLKPTVVFNFSGQGVVPSSLTIVQGREEVLAVNIGGGTDSAFDTGYVGIFNASATGKAGVHNGSDMVMSTLHPHMEDQQGSFSALMGLAGGSLAVGTCPTMWPGSGECSGSIEFYNETTVLSGGAPSNVLEDIPGGSGGVEIMAMLPDGRLIAYDSIFAPEAIHTGGKASAQLKVPAALQDNVAPHQSGLVYTSSNMGEVYFFNPTELRAGGSPVLISKQAAYGIAELSDGALAVAGTYFRAEKGNLTIFEGSTMDPKSGSFKVTHKDMPKGTGLLMKLRASTRVAVAVADGDSDFGGCDRGHIEIYEEEALRAGDGPSAILATSGSVNRMTEFPDGRLAVTTIWGGFHGGWCGTGGTVDIFDLSSADASISLV